MGFLDRLFGRRRRGQEGDGTTASTAPIYTTTETARQAEGSVGRDDERDEGGSGEAEVGPATQDIDVGGSGDAGGGDGGGGDGGGGNGGGGGE
jgi:hypothetical protein